MIIIHYKQVALRIGQCLFSVNPSIYLKFLEKSHDRDSSSSNIKLLEMSYKEKEHLLSERASLEQRFALRERQLDSFSYKIMYKLKALCLCSAIDYKQRAISDNARMYVNESRSENRLQAIALKISGYELVEDLFKARIVICMLYKPKFLERSVFNIIPNDVVDHIIRHWVMELLPTDFDWLNKFDTTFHYEQHGAHQLSHPRLRTLPLKKVS